MHSIERRYQEFKAKGLKLDMTRGKPSSEQLDLAAGLLTNLGPSDYKAADGTDTRNYGGLDGIAEMKAIFAEMMDTTPSQVVVGGNSSLQIMHDTIVRALLHGVPDGDGPWARLPTVKFICPTPGYDRHFAICEHHGIEMVSVDMTDEGPDMDQVERLVAADAGDQAACGSCRSTAIRRARRAATPCVMRLARMKTAAPDFRLMWDNAYAVHDLYEKGDELTDILSAAAAAGHPNRPLVFVSTSKISFAGAGIAAMAGSAANIADVKRHAGDSDDRARQGEPASPRALLRQLRRRSRAHDEARGAAAAEVRGRHADFRGGARRQGHRVVDDGRGADTS